MIKYLLSLCLLCSMQVFSQDFDAVKKAFETGNVSELRPLLASTVELSIEGKEMEVGRSDAELRLRTFFDAHPPRSFSVLHSGVSKADVQYMIGSLVSSDGTFRVSAYLQKSAAEYRIQSLEIEAN